VELQRGAEREAKILEHDGPQCLLRPEYRLDGNGLIGTSPYSQGIDLSPFEASPPPSSESPDSVLSQDGSAESHITNKTFYSTNNASPKKFPCGDPGCPYSADRRDHVSDHFRARHLGIYYRCSLWCVPNCPSSIIDIYLNISVERNILTREISNLIHHANLMEKK
jgi:hypothetical protein